MSRTGRRRFLLVAVAAGALAAPAGAQAASFTVAKGGGTCGGSDLSCDSLVEAAGAVAADDTVSVAPGEYAGATFTDPGVRIVGSTEGTGVVIRGTMIFDAPGANPDILEHVAIFTIDGTGPGVSMVGTSGTIVRDSSVVSANGHGIEISAGTANEVLRSSVASGGGQTAGILVISPGNQLAAKALTVDSSILSGGAGGAGLKVVSQGGLSTGNVTVTARHITIAGSLNGIALDAKDATGILADRGNIAADVRDSIVLGANPTSTSPGIPPLIPGNTATIQFTRTTTSGDPNALFSNAAGRNYRLRPTSPARDAGGAVSPGDSQTDIDGDPRVVGANSDLGADEFSNKPPVARIAVSPAPRSGRTTSFDGGASRDPEGSITQYNWDFGDGTSTQTPTPTVDHVYKKDGPVTASLTVFDSEGASNAAAVGITIADGVAPIVSIDKPAKNKTLRLTTTRTRTVTRKGKKHKVKTTKRNRIAFAGRALDASGVKTITLALRQVSRAKKKATKKKRTATKKKATATARSAAATCRWLDPRRGIVARSCNKPVKITAKLAGNGTWTYTVPKSRRLTAGTYRVFVSGTDNAGNFGNINPVSSVTFKLK